MEAETFRARLRDLPIEEAARQLLGVTVYTEVGGVPTAGRIVETEAYRGADDKAAHSYKYKRTKRTAVFYADAGHAYVYLIYGLHRMFNVVVGPPGEPNAVLVRAVEPVTGIDVMLARRKLRTPGPRIGNGPALVCQALGISRAHYGLDLLGAGSPVRLLGELGTVPAPEVIASPRVGIAYAGECARWPWRFRESGPLGPLGANSYTSPAK